MEKLELESKISHFESMLIAWQDALEELRRQNIAGGLVINGPVRKHEDVVQAMRDVNSRDLTAQEVFKGRIEKLQDELKLLRLELIEIEKSKKEEALKFKNNERRLAILKKPFMNPYHFIFDYKVFNQLLAKNSESGVEFTKKAVGKILNYNTIKSVETFPFYIDILQFIFALGLDLEEVRKTYNEVNSIILCEKDILNNQKLTKPKTNKKLLESKKNSCLSEGLQHLLCYEYNSRKSRYSVSKLKEAGISYSTFFDLINSNQHSKKTSTLSKLESLFEVENNIIEYIPDFDFEKSGVIKYNPPNDIGL
jgi:hypothetical protein